MNLKLDIIEEATRPIIRQDYIKMLFDTRASVPVWCVGYKRFRDALERCVLFDRNDCKHCDVFRLNTRRSDSFSQRIRIRTSSSVESRDNLKCRDGDSMT